MDASGSGKAALHSIATGVRTISSLGEASMSEMGLIAFDRAKDFGFALETRHADGHRSRVCDQSPVRGAQDEMMYQRAAARRFDIKRLEFPRYGPLTPAGPPA